MGVPVSDDDTGYVTFNFDKDGELIDICSYSKSWNRLSQEHMIEQITKWIEEKNAISQRIAREIL